MKKVKMSKKERTYFIKQKIVGLVLATIGVVSIFVEWDATAALLIVPLGLWCVFSKDHLILE